MKHKHGIVCMHRCLNKFTCKRKGSKRCRVAEEAARQPAVCTRQAVLLRSLQSSEETWAQLAAATGECEETAGNDLLGQTLLLRSSKGSSCDEKSLVTGLVNIAVVHVGGRAKKKSCTAAKVCYMFATEKIWCAAEHFASRSFRFAP